MKRFKPYATSTRPTPSNAKVIARRSCGKIETSTSPTSGLAAGECTFAIPSGNFTTLTKNAAGFGAAPTARIGRNTTAADSA